MVTGGGSGRHRVAPWWVLVVLVVTALLAGCGRSGDTTGGAGTPPALPAPAPPAPAPPALPHYTSVTELASAIAAAQQRDKTARLTLTGGLGDPTQPQAHTTINGDGVLRYDQAGPALQLTERAQSGGGPPTELGLVVLPDAAFVRPPPGSAAALPPGKTWLRVDTGSRDAASPQFGQLVQAIRANADPNRAFAQFGDAITIVESIEEPLDGLPSVRYHLRVDLAKAADRQTDPALKQSLAQSVQVGLTTLDYTLWLDPGNRLSRVLVETPTPGSQGIVSLDARYRDWGQPVQIQPPPPEQVLAR